nr:probable serine/threonine-protein kinase nek1 [Paramormyrops kingsleyae]
MDEEIKHRTQREVASLTDMDHRHIVHHVESFTDGTNMHIFYTENSNCYIAMDYCEGGDLSEKIAAQKNKGTSFSEDQILDWFVQICLGLKYVHNSNIVHRDIKPQNVFLIDEKNIKLGDFGVSKILNRKDEYAKNKLETPVYIAPDLWKGKHFNKKSDIWALGCVLYELCTLEFAFSQKEHFFMFELWNKPSPHISQKFSEQLRHLVDELLHKDPAHRPTIDSILKKEFLAKWITKQSEQDIEAFKNLYDRDVGDIQYLVKKLEMTADGLERVHFRTTVGCLTGGVVGAAGGVTSIVGLILAPFTLGASLIVTGVGIGVSVAGWTTSAVSNITNMVNQSKERKTIEETISEYRDKMEPILMSVEDIRTGIEKLKEHESYTNAANMAQTASRAGRGLGGIAELVRLTQVVNIGRVAAQAARVVRVAEVFTGVLSAVFIALDVYFIVKDAKEIHSIRQGSQQQNEIKSATMKLVANIREMVSHFEENLAQLESMRKQIQTEG